MKYLTVSALNKYIKTKLEFDEHLSTIKIKGEISNFKKHSRGHLYFSLKDTYSQINAIMFSSNASKLKINLKDGDKVLIEGKVSVYEPSGTYSIQVYNLTYDGVGDLYLKYEKLKSDLEKKGYFKIENKKNIPLFPKKIGVVTSNTGAVIKDISNTINRRYRLCEIILYSSQVQGPRAAETISNQIKIANLNNEVDILIVGRGGGSIEDLWGFNELAVAEAIFNSKIPIISAVGHETDFTIADFVSDLRAPTPTAAAELATPNSKEIINKIIENSKRIRRRLYEKIDENTIKIHNLEKRLEVSSPKNLIVKRYENLKILKMNLSKYFKQIIDNKRYKYEVFRKSIINLNPLNIMKKGYSIVNQNNKLLKSVKKVEIGNNLEITMYDGKLEAKVLSKEVKDNEE